MMIEPTGCIPTIKARPLPGMSAAGAVIRATARTAPWYAVPVIPSGWEPVHRPVDGELVGYLAPDCAEGPRAAPPPPRAAPRPPPHPGPPRGPPSARGPAPGLAGPRPLAARARRGGCGLPATRTPRVLLAREEPKPEY